MFISSNDSIAPLTDWVVVYLYVYQSPCPMLTYYRIWYTDILLYSYCTEYTVYSTSYN